MEIEDHALLRRYCADGDEEAFGEVVRRHLGLVYGAALRQVGDPGLAEDVSQIVFTRLAQRPQRIPTRAVLAGWLHADTRLTALQLLRGEQRRKAREAEGIELQRGTSQPDWAKIRPLLDEAIERLGPKDRDLLLLRFFEERSLRQTGAVFGLSEDAARMRVTRALDKLRKLMVARGIRTTEEALSAFLTTQAAQAAPSSLGAYITSSALAATGIAGGPAIALLAMSNVKLAVIGLIAAVGMVTPVVWQHRMNTRLEIENRSLRSELVTQRQLKNDAPTPIEAALTGSSQLAAKEEELAKLRDALHQAHAELKELRQRGTAAEKSSPAPAVTEAETVAFLERPKVGQGELLGHLRRQMLGQENRSGPEFLHNRALAEAVRPKLEELESDPEQFAEFQSSFVKAAISLEDEGKVAQIQKIVEETHRQAVVQKLDAASRPPEGVDDWALRRDALDREATHAVQQLLTGDERARFDSAFLGIMGIDLGLNDGTWHRFVTPNGAVIFPSETAGPMP